MIEDEHFESNYTNGNYVSDYKYDIYNLYSVYNFHNNNSSQYEFDYTDIEAPHTKIQPPPILERNVTIEKVLTLVSSCRVLFKVVKKWFKNGCSIGFETQ